MKLHSKLYLFSFMNKVGREEGSFLSVFSCLGPFPQVFR